MTHEEAKEIRALVLAALLDYEDLKKARRIKTVKKAIKGTIAATALSGAGCIHEPSKESLIAQRIIDYKALASNSYKVTSHGVRTDLASQIVENIKQVNQTQTVSGVVHFGFNSSSIALAHKDRLEDFIGQLPKDAELTIIGRTDASGDANYNLELGKKRAVAVAKYLVSKGVAVKSFGSQTIPGGSGWMSRRVDIVVSYKAPENQRIAIHLPPLVKKLAHQALETYNPHHLTKKDACHNVAAKNHPDTEQSYVTAQVSPQREDGGTAIEQAFGTQAKLSDTSLDTIR